MTDPDEKPLDGIEQLDEDELGFDPQEEGVEAPERWSAADRFGTTIAEQRAGESLDEKLTQEQPDVLP